MDSGHELQVTVARHETTLAVHGEQIAEMRANHDGIKTAMREQRDEQAATFKEYRDEVVRLRHTVVGFAFTYAGGIAALIATLIKFGG